MVVPSQNGMGNPERKWLLRPHSGFKDREVL